MRLNGHVVRGTAGQGCFAGRRTAANAYKVHTRDIHSGFKVHAECTQSALQSALQRALQVQQHHAVALRPSLELNWECVHLLRDGNLSNRKPASVAVVLCKSLVILLTIASPGQQAARLEPGAGATFVDSTCALTDMVSKGE